MWQVLTVKFPYLFRKRNIEFFIVVGCVKGTKSLWHSISIYTAENLAIRFFYSMWNQLDKYWIQNVIFARHLNMKYETIVTVTCFFMPLQLQIARKDGWPSPWFPIEISFLILNVTRWESNVWIFQHLENNRNIFGIEGYSRNSFAYYLFILYLSYISPLVDHIYFIPRNKILCVRKLQENRSSHKRTRVKSSPLSIVVNS